MYTALIITSVLGLITVAVLCRRHAKSSKQATYHRDQADHLSGRVSELHEELRKVTNSLEAQKALAELGRKGLSDANCRYDMELAAHDGHRKQLQEANACIAAYKAVQLDHLKQIAKLQDDSEVATHYIEAYKERITGLEGKLANLQAKLDSHVLVKKLPGKPPPGQLYGGSKRTPKK